MKKTAQATASICWALAVRLVGDPWPSVGCVLFIAFFLLRKVLHKILEV
jgi:hypothetical protein